MDVVIDESEFAALAERHRRELHVHCYRMLGSLDDAEDLVQETLLRAWRGRRGFEGRVVARAWLYRIATNACLDALRRRPAGSWPRMSRPPRPTPPTPPRPRSSGSSPTPTACSTRPRPRGRPEAAESRETVELAFLAAIQHLPPASARR